MTGNDLKELSRARKLLASGGARKIREEAGISIHELARAVGVQTSTLSRWERDLRVPKEIYGLRYLALLDELIS